MALRGIACVLDEKGLPSRLWIEQLKEQATKLADSLPPKNGGGCDGGGGVDTRSFAAMEEKPQNVQNHIQDVQREYEQIRAYHEKETGQEAFEVIFRAPLLLSSEHDQLLDGLRKAKYFDSVISPKGTTSNNF